MAATINARMILRDIAERQASGLSDPAKKRKKALEELASERETYYQNLSKKEDTEQDMLRVNRDYAQEMQTVRANTPMVSSPMYKPGSMEEARAYEQQVYATPEAQKVGEWRDSRIADIKKKSGYDALVQTLNEMESRRPEFKQEQQTAQNIKPTRIGTVDPFTLDANKLKNDLNAITTDLNRTDYSRDAGVRQQQEEIAKEIQRRLQMVEDPKAALDAVQKEIDTRYWMKNDSAGYYDGLGLDEDLRDLENQRALIEGYIAGNDATAVDNDKMRQLMMATAGETVSTEDEWLQVFDAQQLRHIENFLPEGKTLNDYSVQDIFKEGIGSNEWEAAQYILMTDGERRAYNALTGDKKAAFWTAMQPVLNERVMQKQEENYAKNTRNKPVLSNLGSLGAELVRPVGSVYALMQAVRGKDIDPNSQFFTAGNMQNATKETTRKMIEEKVENPTAEKVATFAYDAVTGTAENLVRIAEFGGLGKHATTAMMGFGTIGSTAQEVAARDGNNRQAIGLAMLDSAIEIATEYMPIERIFEAVGSAGEKGIKDVLKGIAASMLEEGVGESMSSFLSALADNAVMEEKSNYADRAQQYMLGGMNYEEANKKVFAEILKDAGYSGLVGAVSGGLMQGGAEIAGKVNRTQARKALEALRSEMDTAQQQEEAQPVQQPQMQQTQDQRAQDEAALEEVLDEMAKEATAKKSQITVEKQGEEKAPQPVKTEAQKTAENIQTERMNAKRRKANVEVAEGDEGYILRKDNQNVALEDLDAEDADAIMINAAQGMSQNAANDMLSLYDENSDVTPERYAKGYQAAYAVGMSGQSIENAAGLYMDDLTDAQKKSAWLEGYTMHGQQERRLDSLTRRYANEAGLAARAGKNHTGVSLETVTRKLSGEETIMLRLIDTVAKRYGIDVRVHDTLKDGAANAYMIKGTNQMQLALDAQDGALTRVASHELYHFVEGFAKEDAAAIRKFVLDKLRNTEGYDLEARMDEITELYQRNGVSDFDAESEVVADAMLDIIGTEENLQLMAKENKNLLQKIKEHLQSMMQFIRDALSRAGRRSEEVRALQSDAEYMQEIIRRMDKALQNAQQNYATRAQATQTAMQNDMVQGYLKRVDDAASAEERRAAADKLVENLMYATQEKVINATGDIDGTLEAFRDTLQRFVNGEGQLDSLLEKAGLDATSDEMRPVVAYAAREMVKKGGERKAYNARVKEKAVTEDAYYQTILNTTINEIKEGKYGNHRLRVGKVNADSPYVKIGFPTGSVYLYRSIVEKSMHKHGDHVDEHTLGELSQMLNEPMLITKYMVKGVEQKNKISVYVNYSKNPEKPLVIGMVMNWDPKAGLWHVAIPTMHMRKDVKEAAKDALWVNPKIKKDPTIAPWLQGLAALHAASDDGVINTITYTDDRVNGKSFSLKSDPETERRYQEIFEKQNELRQEERRLMGRKKDFENDAKTLAIIERILAAKTREERKTAVEDEKAHEVKNGIAEIEERLREIKKERQVIEQEENELRAEELRRKVVASGKSEAEYFQKEAVKEFGYTPYFVDAGYILPNGKMLNFSGEKGRYYGMRGQDHRAVSTLFEGTKGATESMVAFMNYGNVRIMDETPGVDLSTATEPTAAQIATIKKHVRESAGRGLYMVDFSDENGRSAGTLTYEGRVNSDRVARDIQHFYETGEIREQSELSRFYSLKSDSGTFFDQVTYDQETRDAGRLIQRLYEVKERVSRFEDDKAAKRVWDVTARDVAKRLLHETGSEMKEAELTRRIKRMYEALDSGDRGTSIDVVMNYAYDIANDLAWKIDMEEDESVREMRDYIKNTRIYLNPDMASEIRAQYGSVQTFMRKYFGKAKFTTTDTKATGLEDMWGELHDAMPGIFQEDAKSDDMIRTLDAWLENGMRTRDQNYYSNSMGQIKMDVAMELFSQYFSTPGVLPTSETVDTMINEARRTTDFVEYQQRINLEREVMGMEYAEKLKDAKAEMRKEAQELRTQLRDKLADMRKTYSERYQKYITNHKESELRYEWRKTVDRNINALRTMLLKPSDKKHVPEKYRDTVGALLEIVSTASANDNYTKRSLSYQALVDQIHKLREEGDLGLAIDDTLLEKITELRGLTEGKTTMAMTSKELQQLNDIIKIVRGACTNYDMMLSEGRKMKASVLGEEFRSVSKHKKDAKLFKQKSALGTAVKFGRWNMEDPVRFFEEIKNVGGEAVGNTLWNILRHEGLDTQIRLVKEAEEKMGKVLDGKAYAEWTGDKTELRTFVTSGGEIKLTTAQMMSLYLLNKREAARNHMYGIEKDGQPNTKDGGIVAGRVDTKEGASKGTRPVKITEADVENITKQLTEEQRKVADGIGEILSGECADWGNEVSMKMYGIKKYKESNYFPIEIWKGMTDQAVAEENKNQLFRAANKSFTKGLVEGAQKPLVINDIFDVAADHINGMIMHRAWTLPVSDIMKFLNYQIMDLGLDTEGDVNFSKLKESLAAGNVAAEMDRVMGEGASKYMYQLLKDINGTVKNPVEKSASNFTNMLTKNFKATAVAYNAGTIMKQPLSIVRAFEEIPAHYFRPVALDKKRTALIEKYAPIYTWKQYGNFTMETGKSMENILYPEKAGWRERVTEWGMKGAGAADNLTLHNIWAAAERMTDARIKNGVEGYAGISREDPDAYYNKVAQIYNNCVDKTQVVDSILHRTEMMRQDSGLLKMLTTFMGEPMKSYNMLLGAVEATVQTGTVESKKKLKRTILNYVTSAVCMAFVNSLVTTLRNWDDDDPLWKQFGENLVGDYEEKTFGEGVQEFFLGNELASNLNPFNMIPVARDMMEILNGYDVERADMALLGDVVDAVRRMGNEGTALTKRVTDLLSAVAGFMGVPVSNLMKEAGRVWNFGNQAMEAMGADTTRMQYLQLKTKKSLGAANLTDYAELILKAEKQRNTKLADRIRQDLMDAGAEEAKLDDKLYKLEVSGLTGMKASDVSYEKTYGALAEAMKAGDKELTEQLRSALTAGGRTEEQINDGLKKYLKENDPRVIEAAKQKAAGNLSGYTSIFPILRAEGFPDEVGKGAVNAAYNAMQTKETKTETKKEENGYAGTYDNTDLKIAVENGSGADAREIIADLRKQGKSDTSIKSTLTSYFKPLYKQLMNGTASDKQAARKLKQTLMSLDLKNKYTEEAIKEWLE